MIFPENFVIEDDTMSDWVQPGLLVVSFVGCCFAVSSWWFWRQARKLAGELADLERNNEALGNVFQDCWRGRGEAHTGAEALTIEARELEQRNETLRRELSWLRDNALEERTALIVALHSWRQFANTELERTELPTQWPDSVALVAPGHRTGGELQHDG
jgi:hypothetical protein